MTVTLSKPSNKQTLSTVYLDGTPIGQVERLGRKWCNNTHPGMYSTRQEAVDAVVRAWRVRREMEVPR